MPVLDRKVHFDPRSRSFAAETADEPQSWTYGLRQDVLDQGQEGHCVGFGIAHEAAATPAVRPQTDQTAHAAFYVAQTIDRAEGRHYDDGATVLAGMKAGVQLGWWTGYTWNFTLAVGLARALARGAGNGPAVLGTNWYRGMSDPVNGRVEVSGPIDGGHCYLARAVDFTTGEFLISNSWGPSWGGATWRGTFRPGHAVVTFEQMDRLLQEQGEAAFPQGRTR